MWKTIAAALLAVCLCACANYKAVGEFGKQTGELTHTVRQEFGQIDELCLKQAELQVVVSNDRDELALKDCAAYRAAQGRLAEVTVDVLDGYAQALEALAEDQRFDFDQSLDNVAGKVQALKDRGGKPLVDAGEVTALSKVVQVLVDVAATRKRDAAVKRLVDETPSLKTTGNILRKYFADANTSSGVVKAPHTNIVAIIDDWATSNQAALDGKALRAAEPIRSYELVRQMRDSKTMLEARRGSAPDSVQGKLVAAIDAWQTALQTFSEEALKPDPKELLDRLKDLRKKAKAARNAVAATGQ
ncbi:MAG TPA: hypothetical protein VFB54_11415 [Burkholderiales bacterium]|nr:hypothetical protein [Burkholderiales bacterium]